MEINETLAEFVWEYSKNHLFCSRAIIAGKYMDNFGIERGRGRTKSEQQKILQRKVSSIFTIMKRLNIATKHSQKAMRINREIFDVHTLEDVLAYSFKEEIIKNLRKKALNS